ncbi:MAG: heat-inducible transcription repressor HrcA [Dehalococcoidia bacterium]|nr:heat-inducible transcription repressor HrcA [Dehalococcoidia bacterium]
MEMLDSLSDRKRQILRAVVGDYVSTAVPVSSDVIARKFPLRVSSATVRNEMAELEDEGYIRRPHISAGGVPSDRGYRYYVEYLTDSGELPESLKRQVLQEFRAVDRDPEAWLQLSAQVLARLAQNLVVVTYPHSRETRVQHIDIAYLQDLLGLLVLVLQQPHVRKEIVPLPMPVTREDMQHASNKLSALYSGLTSREIQAKPVELTPLEAQILAQVLDMMRQEEGSLYEGLIEGLQHLLTQPELTDQQRLADLANLLDSKRIHQVVTSARPDDAKPRVLIGTENSEENLKSFSLILGRYGRPGEATGTIGIVGPTRLDYERSVASIRYLSQLLGTLLEGVHGHLPSS